jgi:hypothetical protein
MGFINKHFTTGQNNTVIWATNIAYAVGDIVAYDMSHFQCVVAHTSATAFATDMNSGKWVNFSRNNLNYVVNNDAEQGTLGWNTYADAAAAPVDGTGGSPTATWGASSSSPLRGTNSYLFTPGALGNGVSYDFIIDAADQAKVLNYSFDFSVASTITEGDYVVYIYDVTNGLLIQPAGYKLSGTSGSTYKQSGTFQTSSNSVSYRLIIHQAVASPAALKVDAVKVSPQVIPMGAPVTDWAAYTPDFKGGTNGLAFTNTTTTGFWRRVGDSMEVKVKTTFQNTPATGTGQYRWSIPTGYTIDTSKLQNTSAGASIEGNAGAVRSGVAFWNGRVTGGGTSTQVSVVTNNQADAWQATGGFPFTWTTNDEAYLKFSVPITGWSSTVQMSNDTDTRVVAMYASGLATGTVVSSFSLVKYPTVVKDSHGAYSASTGKYTVPVSGFYSISGGFRIDVTVTSGQNASECGIIIDGSNTIASSLVRAQASVGPVGFPSMVSLPAYFLNAGQTIEIQAASAGTSPALSNTDNACFFSVARISGPATIAASETVAARWSTTTAVSCSSGTSTDITWNSKTFDTHGMLTSGSASITIPVAGKYRITTNISINNVSWSAGGYAYIRFLKDGSSYAQTGLMKNITAGALSFDWIFHGSTTVDCVAGTVLKVQLPNNTGSTLVLDGTTVSNWVCVERIGN